MGMEGELKYGQVTLTIELYKNVPPNGGGGPPIGGMGPPWKGGGGTRC